ncbi:hypothetical protein Bbelb_429320 [Branchiostoma belcheri]|nr:hypothetical protein Bbelb_429320 [Branchiostoma belcheri]
MNGPYPASCRLEPYASRRPCLQRNPTYIIHDMIAMQHRARSVKFRGALVQGLFPTRFLPFAKCQHQYTLLGACLETTSTHTPTQGRANGAKPSQSPRGCSGLGTTTRRAEGEAGLPDVYPDEYRRCLPVISSRRARRWLAGARSSKSNCNWYTPLYGQAGPAERGDTMELLDTRANNADHGVSMDKIETQRLRVAGGKRERTKRFLSGEHCFLQQGRGKESTPTKGRAEKRRGSLGLGKALTFGVGQNYRKRFSDYFPPVTRNRGNDQLDPSRHARGIPLREILGKRNAVVGPVPVLSSRGSCMWCCDMFRFSGSLYGEKSKRRAPDSESINLRLIITSPRVSARLLGLRDEL